MSGTVTLRVPAREKQTWQRVAKAVGEDLGEFIREAVRQRIQGLRAKQDSPWSDLLGSVTTDAPAATNRDIRKAMRMKRS